MAGEIVHHRPEIVHPWAEIVHPRTDPLVRRVDRPPPRLTRAPRRLTRAPSRATRVSPSPDRPLRRPSRARSRPAHAVPRATDAVPRATGARPSLDPEPFRALFRARRPCAGRVASSARSRSCSSGVTRPAAASRAVAGARNRHAREKTTRHSPRFFRCGDPRATKSLRRRPSNSDDLRRPSPSMTDARHAWQARARPRLCGGAGLVRTRRPASVAARRWQRRTATRGTTPRLPPLQPTGEPE